MSAKLTKILLIEDNLGDVRLIREMLTRSGFLRANSGHTLAYNHTM